MFGTFPAGITTTEINLDDDNETKKKIRKKTQTIFYSALYKIIIYMRENMEIIYLEVKNLELK
jgi:hypothetical protein